jgi:hypothetical protein
LQDSNYACFTKEARAQNDLARPIKEAKALNIKTNSKNTIIIDIPKRSPIKGKSRTICINFTTLRKKDKVKAKKANKAKSRD